ncbi:winged helix-turn-helix transcriptional regulator [Halapricum hydrolyticum]|uniref:Winged helix-turn-helix transcriptional regulator n=1 Tax=Halapricum hydrolyticum TaxID=2979991 RepID=A0AAE3IBJ1_9EURY|nr:winged helix-turn-helix transcriptional regulator [Halapricum hydrolyticum]MCU4717712.1 winged helix-turn-helix transcriptional regulator [Halapricum hydrolyticum]MCU4726759.1 winged helix-turn-helix transcriptional regulator [Halapricum hydrolyticum]
MSDEGVDESKRATLRRFAALGTAGSIARFAGGAEATAGDSDARDAIVGYLEATPGAHFSKIRDDLHLGTGETQHHLRQLLETDTIESHEDGDYRRFFPAGRFDDFEKTALSYLRRDTVRGMLVALLEEPEATGSDLAEAVGVSRSTVSKYASELQTVGLLDRTDGYRIVNPETVLLLLVRYADSFDADAESFARDAASVVTYDP